MLQSQALSTWTVKKTQQMLGACAPLFCALELRSYFERLDSSSTWSLCGRLLVLVASLMQCHHRHQNPPKACNQWIRQVAGACNANSIRNGHAFGRTAGSCRQAMSGAILWELPTLAQWWSSGRLRPALERCAEGPHGSFVSHSGVLHNTRRTATTCFGLAA